MNRETHKSNDCEVSAALSKTAIPKSLGLGSPYPSRDITEANTTYTASTTSRPPAICAARCSACSDASVRKRHSTIAADINSTALSPPKAAKAGLRAVHAAHSDKAASTLIQAIVNI